MANRQLFAACAKLDETEYRKPRNGSLGSIHGLLNHVLLGDRIWMARFEGGGRETPPLDTILTDGFSEMRSERRALDARIEEFSGRLGEDFFSGSFRHRNNLGWIMWRRRWSRWAIFSITRRTIAGRRT
jgi:uncharacterized damage-inducible protein DinB